MKKLTDEQKAIIGTEIAEIFQLKQIKTKKGKYLFLTFWGYKSALGLFETFMTISNVLRKESRVPGFSVPKSGDNGEDWWKEQQ